MAEHVERKWKPAEEIEIVTHISCDICGATVGGEGRFDVNDVTIERETGEEYPDCAVDKKSVYYDVCGKCFDEKVAPFLVGIGVKPREKDRSW